MTMTTMTMTTMTTMAAIILMTTMMTDRERVAEECGVGGRKGGEAQDDWLRQSHGTRAHDEVINHDASMMQA
eukprot:1519128-Rhodomonas_salina.5